MVDAVTAPWHGANYQSRVFWENALNLLAPHSCVVEVTFEANGPKAFDDVVVKYDPPIVRSGSERVAADYHQVKWHVQTGGRFGFADFIDPDFIGAKSVSLLQRLQQARETTPTGANFTFLTTYRIADGDPLATLVSGNDRSLLVQKLFDGTTDKSRMGQVRKLWREHLGLDNDDALREVVSGLRVVENYRSLDELRTQINYQAQVVGLLTHDADKSDFRYDELARQLKARGLSALNREALKQLCVDEGLWAPSPAATGLDTFRPVAIRSFAGPAADIAGAAPDDTLLLTGEFRQRYLGEGRDWQRDIRPRVDAFLREAVKKSAQLRLILDAHASIAFIAGAALDLKSGVQVELVQKGRVGARLWRADDGTSGPPFMPDEEVLGVGREIAVTISAAQVTTLQVRAYVATSLPEVGKLVSFGFAGGAGQQSVVGGGHAAALADHISNYVRNLKATVPDALLHLFAAVPNALLFYLGQQHQSIAPCVVYEYDFDRQGNKTYQPSFVIR